MADTYLRRHTGDAFLGQDRSELHAAAFQGQLMTIFILIKRGADINKKTSDGVTPLHEACSRGFIYCAEILIKHGADLTASNIDGSTPICDASCYGEVDIVKLLLSKGANPNPPMARTSPLHEAAMRGHTQCVEALIEAGAKLEYYDGHYGSSLHAAVSGGKTDTARVLLKAGANVNAIMNHTSSLHMAAANKDADIIELLLDYGADFRARNNQHKTPMDFLMDTDCKAKKVLELHISNPRSLAELSRRLIRILLGAQRLTRASDLGLPKIMVDYVLYR